MSGNRLRRRSVEDFHYHPNQCDRSVVKTCISLILTSISNIPWEFYRFWRSSEVRAAAAGPHYCYLIINKNFVWTSISIVDM
jgi:hypothetical protein